MSRIDTDWVKSMENELAGLRTRIEGLEQRVLVIGQPKWRPTLNPYDLGAIAAYSSKLRRKR